MDGECLSAAYNEAELSLICLPYELSSDLAFAPKLCFRNISRREEREEGIKMINPFSQGHF